MDDSFDILFSCRTAKQTDLIALILTSQGIAFQIEKKKSHFFILTREDDRKKAVTAIHLYFTENRFFRIKQQIAQFPISAFKSIPAFLLMMFMTLIHMLSTHYQAHEQMVLKYGSSALYIMQGDAFRAITALFLHADTGHLMGNLVGILIFVAPVYSLSGYGTGSLMLLLTGTTGNLINACFYKTAHLSIGASTTIMGAAGLLVACQMVYKKNGNAHSLMPVFSGAILVSLLSQGENTDVWAHVFGFVSGLISGFFLFPLNHMISFKHREILALTITLVIVAASFLSAV